MPPLETLLTDVIEQVGIPNELPGASRSEIPVHIAINAKDCSALGFYLWLITLFGN